MKRTFTFVACLTWILATGAQAQNIFSYSSGDSVFYASDTESHCEADVITPFGSNPDSEILGDDDADIEEIASIGEDIGPYLLVTPITDASVSITEGVAFADAWGADTYTEVEAFLDVIRVFVETGFDGLDTEVEVFTSNPFSPTSASAFAEMWVDVSTTTEFHLANAQTLDLSADLSNTFLCSVATVTIKIDDATEITLSLPGGADTDTVPLNLSSGAHTLTVIYSVDSQIESSFSGVGADDDSCAAGGVAVEVVLIDD